MKKFFSIAAFLLGMCQVISAQETKVLYLSGHDKDDAVPWKFFCTSGAHSGYWTNINVPSQWDVLGFGTLNYHKDLTNAWDERGLYEHEFSVPAEWSGSRIFLVFEGVMTDTDAKLNGQSVGPVHQGSFYRFKYEVTSLVNPGGTNKLEVTVSKHSANASVNKAERLADFWVFGGIFRPVYLEAVPGEFIQRVAVDAKEDGSFSADVFLGGASNGDEIEAQIQSLDGHNVSEVFTAVSTNAFASVNLKTTVSVPKLWTAETPNLYQAVFRLKHSGNVVHEMTQRFGFRTFEVRDGDGFYLNGQRIILKGANRHSFWPDSGRCLSETVHRLDINTLKDANMNAVRMSHYPPDVKFLDLCDEMGIYVLDEIAGWHNHYDNDIGPKLVREMLARDVNHPSILFWDNGNEGGFNTNLDSLYPALDPQKRRVLHPWMAFDGVNTAHYLSYDQAVIASKGTPLYYHPNGKTFADTNDTAKYIYMPTEFVHGLFDGGAGAGLDDYWRMMSKSKVLGGGFIWALLDDGIKRPDTGEIDVAGNQAPDGIVGPYRQREGSFYAIKQIWSPIQILETNLPAKLGSKSSLTLTNSYSFTDASRCKFTWQLRRFRRPGEVTSNETVCVDGVPVSPAIPPGGSGKLNLNLPENFRHTIEATGADAFSLRVEDPTGRELWTWVWPLKLRQEQAVKVAGTQGKVRPSIKQENGILTAKAGELTANFDGGTGMLVGIKMADQSFSLTNGPRFTLGSGKLLKLKTKTTSKEAIVTATYDGSLKSVTWHVRNDGWVDCAYTYNAHGTNDFPGVTFDYPENLVTHKRWLGNGPYRVWKNRLKGVSLGVWENDYNNTLTGYHDWIYPEFKGFFSGVRWLELDTKEGLITVVNNSGVPFMQVLTPEFPPTNLVGKAFAPVPKCGLAFLDAIPPIGSKFKEAAGGGPQGQPNSIEGEFSGSLSLHFRSKR